MRHARQLNGEVLGQRRKWPTRFGKHNTCGNDSGTNGRQPCCTERGCTHQYGHNNHDHHYDNNDYDNNDYDNNDYDNNHDYDNNDSRTDHYNVYDYINNIYDGCTDDYDDVNNIHDGCTDYNHDGSTDDYDDVNDDNSCTARDHRSVNNDGCSKHHNVNISCAASTGSTSCGQRI